MSVVLPLGARVGFIIQAGDVAEIEIGVNLRGRKAAVSEQLLHRPDVARSLQQVSGIAVAHHMRRNVSAVSVLRRPLRQTFLDLALAQARAVPACKQGFAVRCRLTQRQIVFQGFHAVY